MLSKPIFVPNSADGNHCGPACWRMTLETYFPEQEWSFDKIDQIIRKEPGKYTWAQTFRQSMMDAGCNIQAVGTFDEREFIKRHFDYTEERSGAEFAADQKAHAPTDMEFVISCMQSDMNDSRFKKEFRPATFDDLTKHLEAGAYTEVHLNPRILRGAEGVSSHSVLVYGLDDKNIYFMDPGPRDAGDRTIDRELFSQAWGNNRPETRVLSAYYKAA